MCISPRRAWADVLMNTPLCVNALLWLHLTNEQRTCLSRFMSPSVLVNLIPNPGFSAPLQMRVLIPRCHYVSVFANPISAVLPNSYNTAGSVLETCGPSPERTISTPEERKMLWDWKVYFSQCNRYVRSTYNHVPSMPSCYREEDRAGPLADTASSAASV